jgi:hypothetical protein
MQGEECSQEMHMLITLALLGFYIGKKFEPLDIKIEKVH